MAELATAYVTLMPTLKGAQAQISSQLSGINTSSLGNALGSKLGSGVSSGLSSAKVAIGNVLANVAMAGIGAITSSMDSAISRVDTLNQFPRVMGNIGFSAEDAQGSINKLGEAINGLPTTLDGIVGQTQQFAMTLGDLNLATDVAIAANDALVTFGASSEGAGRAVTQLNQMIATGKYDMQSWNSVNSVAPGMLDSIAKAMLGESATAGQLREALNDGKISTSDFLNKLVELDQEGSDSLTAFSQTAKDATGGIATSMANVRTAVVKNLANVINAFNGESGNITKIFDGMKLAINGLGTAILPVAEVFGDMFGKMVGMAIPYLEGFSKRCGTFAKTFRAVFQDSGNVLESFAWGLKYAFVDTPLEKPLSIMAQAVQGFFDKLHSGGSIIDGFRSALDVIPDTLKEFKDAFSGVLDFVEPFFDAFESRLGIFKDSFQTAFEETNSYVLSFVYGLQDAFAGTPLGGVFDTLSNAVQSFFSTLRDGGTYLEAFKSAIGEIPAIVKIAAGAAAGLVGAFKLASVVPDIVNTGKHLFTLGENATAAASKIPLLGSAFGSINGQMNGFHGAVTSAGGGLKGLAAVARNQLMSALTSASLRMGVFQSSVSMAGGGLKGVISVIGGMMGPVGIAIAAIAALAAIFVTLYNTNDEFRASMNALGADLMASLKPAIDSLMQSFQEMATAIMPALITVVQAIIPVITTIATSIAGLVASVLPILAQLLASVVVPAVTLLAGLIATIAPIIAEIIAKMIEIVSTIIGLVMPIITAIMELISAAMPVIQAIIETTMTVIQAVIETVWPIVQSVIETTMNVIQAVIEAVLAAIQGNWDGVWTAIGNLCDAIWNGIGNIISTVISTVQSVISNALSTIQSIWESCWNAVCEIVQKAWDDLCTAVSNGISKVMEWIGQIPDKIKGFFANAGQWLVSAGKAIIDGFLNGLKAAWGGVTSFISGIGDWIMANKGPEDYDKRLLIPAGKWIMGGLQNGLVSGFEGVKSTLHSATDQIEGFSGAYYDAGSTIAQAIGDGMEAQAGNLAASTADLLNDGIGSAFDNLDVGLLAKDANQALGDVFAQGATDGIASAARQMDRSIEELVARSLRSRTAVPQTWRNYPAPASRAASTASYQGSTNIYATVSNPQDWDKVAANVTSKQERMLKACGLL